MSVMAVKQQIMTNKNLTNSFNKLRLSALNHSIFDMISPSSKTGVSTMRPEGQIRPRRGSSLARGTSLQRKKRGRRKNYKEMGREERG